MTIKECIKSLYVQEVNASFETSNKCLINTPRKGCELEYKFHCERAAKLGQLIALMERFGS